jgi:hypothetical protein
VDLAYSSDGVGLACIAPRQRRGIDVNPVLLRAWNGASGRDRLSTKEPGATLAAA